METKARISLEEYFERFDSDNPTELIDGEMVPLEQGMTFRDAFTVGRLVTLLSKHVGPRGPGFVLVDYRFVLGLPHDPDAVRLPDVAFVRADRADVDAPASRGAPDLAIEVISPSDKMIKTIKKAREYLITGARLVWVIVSETRTVMVYRPDGNGTILGDTDVLEGEDVLPGLVIPVQELFLPQ